MRDSRASEVQRQRDEVSSPQHVELRVHEPLPFGIRAGEAADRAGELLRGQIARRRGGLPDSDPDSQNE